MRLLLYLFIVLYVVLLNDCMLWTEPTLHKQTIILHNPSVKAVSHYPPSPGLPAFGELRWNRRLTSPSHM